MAAEITDEAIAALRARIGVPQPHPQPPHYLTPNEDAFRHVAESYGDDNPLWCDPDHGATTRWGGVDRPAAPGRRRHPHRRERGHRVRRRDRGPDEGRPAARGPCLLFGEPPRVVAAAVPRGPDRPPQRPRRRPRQGGRVRGTGRARVDGRGLLPAGRSAPGRPVPAHDPGRAGEGGGVGQVRRHRDPPVHRRGDRAHHRSRRWPRATAAGGPSPAGGRRWPRATSSSPW